MIRNPNSSPRNTASSKNAVAIALRIAPGYDATGGSRTVW